MKTPSPVRVASRYAGSRETLIPWTDVLKAYSDLGKVAAKYKRYEGPVTSGPAGPDTSKFQATHSGFIEPTKWGEAGYMLIGLKIGENFYSDPSISTDDLDGWLAHQKKRDALVDKIQAEADRVLIPFMKKTGLDRVFRKPQYKDGSNYGTYGIQAQRWMKVIDDVPV